MKCFRIITFVALLFYIGMLNISGAEDNLVKIGVLAKRGPEMCLKKWSPTAEYLSAKIPGKTFEVVPIDFEQIYSCVEKGDVDFILANPSFYVELESWYGANRIATLKNLRLDGAFSEFGGVIFCKANRNDIRQLNDLKGKTFMAVKETSFGGWRMAWRELKDKGIDPHRDFQKLEFGGTHDTVVYAVKDGKVDAGTIRTDTLERMQAEGKIKLDDYYVIHEHGGGTVHLPFLHSTRSYPEWPMAKVIHVSEDLAEKVTVALLQMPPDSHAAIAAKCAGWTIPLNYQTVHECLRELKIGPYKDIEKITFGDVVSNYWHWIISIFTLFFLSVIISVFSVKFNAKLGLEITERKQAEEALRVTSERLELAMDAGEHGFWDWNIDTNEVFFSPRYYTMLGYENKELPMVLDTWINLMHPEDRKTIVPEVQKYVENAEPYEIEFRLKCKDGPWKWISGRGKSFELDENGVSHRAVGLHVDITDRKRADEALRESEERLKAIFDANPDPIVVYNNQGHPEYLNAAFTEVFGWPLDELRGQRIPFVPDAQKEITAAKIDELYASGKPVRFDTQRLNKQGDTIDVIVSAAAIRGSEGESVGMVVNLTDITERKGLEAQLQQAQKMEAIGTLAGGIAHDFNNALYSIIGYTDLTMEDMPEDSLAQSNLKEVLIAANRAKDMVQQILTFSRQTETEKKPVKVQTVVKEAIKLLKTLIPTTIEIRRNIDADCKPVLADPTQIHQVVMNLATNAYHAMREKGGVLTIDVAKEEISMDDSASYLNLIGTYIKLTVSDTGHGMDKAVMEKIFDPYFTTKPVGEGTGMGLSTVHGIVKSHGGYIKVYSEPGKGTVFHVYFPLIETKPVEPKIVSTGPIPKGSESILLVDDEEPIVRMVKQTLERLGYQVATRTGSVDALEAFRAGPDKFDLVITDMTMPNMNGVELAPRLLEIRPDIPIILCTGFSEITDENKAKASGIREFVMKPVVRDEIARTIRKVLDE